MFEPVRAIIRKEFIQAFRDPRMRAVLVVVPLVQLLVFGYAVTTDVRDVRLAVVDRDNTPQSRELVSRFTGSGYFQDVAHPSGEKDLKDLMDRGKVRAALVVDAGFGGELASSRSAPVQLILDGTDSNTASLVLGYAGRIVEGWSSEILAARMARQTGGRHFPPPVVVHSRAWFNENLESRNYFVPGVIALLLMVTTLLLSSMAIVREKEAGTIEQVMVTPITRWEFILGKTVPFVVIGYLNVAMISTLAVLWFRIPIRGSLLLLAAATGLYLMSMLGIGLYISTVSRTQQQAMMTTFFFTMPFVLLSGFIYPIANMPGWIQVLSYANPVRYFLVVVRGIFLKGVGLDILWPQLAALAAMGIITLTLASLRFRKTIG
jgi:ABC-2 type transport system permease protein